MTKRFARTAEAVGDLLAYKFEIECVVVLLPRHKGNTQKRPAWALACLRRFYLRPRLTIGFLFARPRARRAPLNGATTTQLMAIYDWSTPAEVYTRAANRTLLAGQAMPLLGHALIGPETAYDPPKQKAREQ